MHKLVLVLFLGVLVSGCAIGNSYRYDLGDAAFTVKSDKTVAVSAVDLRPYVRPDDKTPDFVGLQRGGFGNPFDVTTRSGKPLAEDMATSIVKALNQANVRAFSVAVASGSGVSAAREQLLKADAERFALLLIREWKTNTYVNTELFNDITLQVLRDDGSQIAEKTLQGRETLGATFVPADARVHAEKAFKARLESVFNDPEIAGALR